MPVDPEETGTRPFNFGTQPESLARGDESPPTLATGEDDEATRAGMPASPTQPAWPTSDRTLVAGASDATAPAWPASHSNADEVTSTEESPATRAIPCDEVPTPGPFPDGKSGAFWDTVEASGEFRPGQVIFNRYIVQQKIGRGGMGAVWLVTHRELNTDRALKLIVAGISYDGQARARFRREAQVMAQFVHPNAVIVHDARLTENDVAYIDMEFVQGRSLDRVIRRGEPMPLAWVARVLDQLCDVLEVAHQKGIVHRDLKPANLMLLDDRPEGKEHLKVLDFGIAKILGDAETQGPHTMTGVFMGTPPYASPEQADGKADTRSDVYSVGVILYEFLTGFRPFSGPAARVLVDTIMQPPPTFATVNPNIACPPEIEAVVMRCLEKGPENRFQTAGEVARAFRAALPPELRQIQGKATVEIVEKPVPWLPIAAGVVIIALLAVFAESYFARSRARVTSKGEVGVEPPPIAVRLPGGFEAAPKADRDPKNRPLALVPTGPAAPLGIKMILIPGGTFQMGEKGLSFEQKVADFAMSETEVTNGQMHAYLKAKHLTPPPVFEKAFQDLIAGNNTDKVKVSPEEAELHPAVGVPHALALDFARWVGAGLPTEAQWEYAARSRGLRDRPYTWSDPTPIGANAGKSNIDSLDTIPTRTVKVKNKPDDRTEQGIYDMVGNVREWCRDPDATQGVYSVRGGSWNTIARDYSNYQRGYAQEADSMEDLGFRIVVEWPSDGTSKSPR